MLKLGQKRATVHCIPAYMASTSRRKKNVVILPGSVIQLLYDYYSQLEILLTAGTNLLR